MSGSPLGNSNRTDLTCAPGHVVARGSQSPLGSGIPTIQGRLSGLGPGAVGPLILGIHFITSKHSTPQFKKDRLQTFKTLSRDFTDTQDVHLKKCEGCSSHTLVLSHSLFFLP